MNPILRLSRVNLPDYMVKNFLRQVLHTHTELDLGKLHGCFYIPIKSLERSPFDKMVMLYGISSLVISGACRYIHFKLEFKICFRQDLYVMRVFIAT